MQKVSHMQNTTLSLFESPRQTAIREDPGERSARNRGALSRTWSRLSIHIVETWASCPRCGAPASESSTCDRSADLTACAATPAAPSIIDGIMKIHPSALNDSRPGARTSSVTAPRQNPPSGHRPSGRRPRHDTKKYTEDTNMPPIEPVASLPTTINARRRGFSPSLQNARQGEHVVPLSAHVSASSTITT